MAQVSLPQVQGILAETVNNLIYSLVLTQVTLIIPCVQSKVFNIKHYDVALCNNESIQSIHYIEIIRAENVYINYVNQIDQTIIIWMHT